jgi:hypothetical protein
VAFLESLASLLPPADLLAAPTLPPAVHRSSSLFGQGAARHFSTTAQS